MTSDECDIRQGLSLIKTYTPFQSITIRDEMPSSIVVNIKHLGVVVTVKHLGRINLGSNPSNTPC